MYHAGEAGTQLLQGVLAGVALALLAYSLTHWFSLRDPMFLEYALLLAGVTTFFVTYFGIGQQHLWNDQTGLLGKVAPLSVLTALAGGSLFVASAMQTRTQAPRTHRGLQMVAACATLVFVASIAGLLDYRLTQTLATRSSTRCGTPGASCSSTTWVRLCIGRWSKPMALPRRCSATGRPSRSSSTSTRLSDG